jgi:lipid-A-disaccharide synthase
MLFAFRLSYLTAVGVLPYMKATTLLTAGSFRQAGTHRSGHSMPSSSPRIWINAAETSGDLHGALLADALKMELPGPALCGMAGPAMRKAGVEDICRTEELSVMGLTEVLAKLPKVYSLLGRIKDAMQEQKPDALVLIDAPSFNFRVAKIAKALGIPVYYYISPKIWARSPKRAYFIRDYVRRMICILPFEGEFYADYGVDVDYVGHPLVDETSSEELSAIQHEDGHVGILPGSRSFEIKSLLPRFGEAARLLLAKRPHLRFTIVQAPGVEEEKLRALWPADVPVKIVDSSNRYADMRRFSIALAASGTVTLECALLGVPCVVAYKLSALTFLLARMLVTVRRFSLPNLILAEDLLPELLQENTQGAIMAAHAALWLDSPEQLQGVRKRLGDLREMLGPPGACKRAAGIIAEDLRKIGA